MTLSTCVEVKQTTMAAATGEKMCCYRSNFTKTGGDTCSERRTVFSVEDLPSRRRHCQDSSHRVWERFNVPADPAGTQRNGLSKAHNHCHIPIDRTDGGPGK